MTGLTVYTENSAFVRPTSRGIITAGTRWCEVVYRPATGTGMGLGRRRNKRTGKTDARG